MKFVPRRPVTKAIQYVAQSGAALTDLRDFIERTTHWQIESIAETSIIGSRSIRIVLNDGGQTIVVRPTDWLCIDERAAISVLPSAEFNRTYEPMDLPPSVQTTISDRIAGEAACDQTSALILAEIKALHADLARERACHQPLSTRIASTRIKL